MGGLGVASVDGLQYLILSWLEPRVEPKYGRSQRGYGASAQRPP